jgi:hypothetical protein
LARLNGLRIEKTCLLFRRNNDESLLGDPPYEWMRKVWMEGREIGNDDEGVVCRCVWLK